MQPNSHRNELHNNYIKGLFKMNPEDESKLENTNNALLISTKEFMLNKKIIKGQQGQFSNTIIKSNSLFHEDEELAKKRNEWKKNILKISSNMQERKIIYSLEPELGDDLSNKNKNTIFAYKDNGFYAIYKYINSHNNYDKEIKARLKWNLLSNKFKIFDNKNKLIEEINYNLNFKGWSGPTKLQVIIHENNNLNFDFMNNAYKMENKSPEYNSIYKTYVLNFINRKVIPNEKNIQIIFMKNEGWNNGNKNDILLQFAQTQNNEFILDFKYPFNNITAFALALSCLSSRTFCK
jgi:hypothetical protein